jgi:hypothetical protein
MALLLLLGVVEVLIPVGIEGSRETTLPNINMDSSLNLEHR